MADKLKQSGYFPWIPIEYYRERPKGILINQSTYPTSFTTLYKQKLDFAVMRCSYESATSVYTSDTFFTETNIRAFESRGITTLAYHQIVNNPTYWTQAKAESHATSFYNALIAAYALLGKEFIPVIVFTDNTTAFNISALYSYLSYFKTKFATLSSKEIIFSSDRASFSYCTYNTSVRIASLFPKLMLDKAESYDYSGLAYPQTVHTKFDRYIDWSFWIYTRSNSLGATYGLNTTAAILIIADTNYINRLNPKEYTTNATPKVDLFVLDEFLDTQGYITGHNLKWQRKINGIDILQGEVWESCDYLAEGNYVLFKDPFRQVWEMFEIMEIDYNINSKNIYCEHISHTLLDDIVHTTTITTTSNISTHISNILSSTYSTNGIWEAGTRFGGAGLSSQIANQRLKNLMEAIIHIRDVFGFELVFRPQIVSRRTDALTPNYQGFFIDMYFFIGRHDNDFRLEVGKNVSNLERHVNYKDIITAIFPYSASVSSATWLAYVASAGGGTYSKVLNNRLIRYIPSENRYGRHIYSTIKNKIATYEGTETTASALFDNAVLSLQDMNKDPKVSYECDIFDVEVCLGDNITIYNSDIKPKVWGEDLPANDSDYGTEEYFYNKNLRIQGRITEIEYELNDMRNVKINIGNVREDFIDTYTS